VAIFVNQGNLFSGSSPHVGVIGGIGLDRHPGERFLYDPGGSYAYDRTGGDPSDLMRDGFEFFDYYNYQRSGNSLVDVYIFHTTRKEEQAILSRIEAQGSHGPGFCVEDVRAAVSEIGPFQDLQEKESSAWRWSGPRVLGDELRRLRR
jgi:hypothetical protein